MTRKRIEKDHLQLALKIIFCNFLLRKRYFEMQNIFLKNFRSLNLKKLLF
jgi:hypothetical protein